MVIASRPVEPHRIAGAGPPMAPITTMAGEPMPFALCVARPGCRALLSTTLSCVGRGRLHQRRRRASGGSMPPFMQRRGNPGELRHWHVEDDRLAEPRQCLPVALGRAPASVLVRDGRPPGPRHGWCRAWSPECRPAPSPARAGGQAGNDAKADAGLRPSAKRLVPAAAEHEGIAALQSHHAAAGAGALDQHVVDVALMRRRPAAALAGRDHLRVVAAKVQHSSIDQRVVDDVVGLADGVQRQQREQARIAGPCARQPDLAGREVGQRREVLGITCSLLPRPRKRRW